MRTVVNATMINTYFVWTRGTTIIDHYWSSPRRTDVIPDRLGHERRTVRKAKVSTKKSYSMKWMFNMRKVGWKLHNKQNWSVEEKSSSCLVSNFLLLPRKLGGDGKKDFLLLSIIWLQSMSKNIVDEVPLRRQQSTSWHRMTNTRVVELVHSFWDERMRTIKKGNIRNDRNLAWVAWLK